MPEPTTPKKIPACMARDNAVAPTLLHRTTTHDRRHP